MSIPKGDDNYSIDLGRSGLPKIYGNCILNIDANDAVF